MSTWDLITFVHMKRSPGELLFFIFFPVVSIAFPLFIVASISYGHLISISE